MPLRMTEQFGLGAVTIAVDWDRAQQATALTSQGSSWVSRESEPSAIPVLLVGTQSSSPDHHYGPERNHADSISAPGTIENLSTIERIIMTAPSAPQGPQQGPPTGPQGGVPRLSSRSSLRDPQGPPQGPPPGYWTSAPC